uniref:LolnoRGD n=1 Tax=Bichromomyia olmeca TaxID=715919 RepID=A0A1B1V3E7_9DIPT|nr:LolnoRGD [Bichromomyia olmeca]
MNKVVLFTVVFVALVFCANAMPKEEDHVNMLDDNFGAEMDTVAVEEDIASPVLPPCDNPMADC